MLAVLGCRTVNSHFRIAITFSIILSRNASQCCTSSLHTFPKVECHLWLTNVAEVLQSHAQKSGAEHKCDLGFAGLAFQ